MTLTEEITSYLEKHLFPRKSEAVKLIKPKTSSKTLPIEGIGEVVFRKNRRNKRTRITIKPPCTVRVSLPYQETYARAEKFVKSQKDWILDNLEKMKSIQKPKEIIDNYKTRQHTLYFEPRISKRVSCSVREGRILVCYPENLTIHEDFIQSAVRKGIDAALKLEAEAYLPQRTELLSRKTGIMYGKLAVTRSKRYWGMCMSDNSIKLNFHLMRLPDELIDFVILHELAHIREKNHGSRFYDVLATLVPEPKVIRGKLKKYSPTRYN